MDKKIEILLIEDNPGDANLIEDLLEEFANYSYEIKNVATLNEGLSLLKERPFDVILLDLGLPDSDGIDTFLSIYRENPLLPIIILTGLDDEIFGSYAVEKGAQDYLVKGQTDDRLLRSSIRHSIERKKIEEKIRNLASIVESSNDAIITVSLDVIITSWNRGAEQIYGYSDKEILGKTISVLASSLLIEETKKLIEMIKQGEKIRHYETSRIRKDGTVIDVSVTLSPVFDIFGKLTDISVISRDITERKRAEKELKESEERYRIVTEQTGQLIYDYDLRTDKGNWAGNIEKITGYSPQEFEELSSEVWIEHIHPEDRERIVKKLGEVRKKGGNYREEFRLKRKDGIYFYTEDSGVYLVDKTGQPYRALGVMKDITEQKLTLKQLEKSEERYRIVTEQTGQLIYDFDIQKNKINWAGAIEAITGYTAEEFKQIHGISWLKSIHPEDLKTVRERVDTFLNKGGKLNHEFRFRRNDGKYICIEERGISLVDENERLSRILGVMIDITESKLAHQKVQQSEERYRSFMQNFKGIAFQTDENFIPQFLHGAVKEITGYSEEEFMSSKLYWTDIIDPECLPVIFETRKDIREIPDSCIAEVEYRIRSKNGEPKWVHETCQKVSGENGNYVYQCVVYNITERKETEEYLANLEVARKKEIHHRIKNNLQVISSLLDLQAEKFNNRGCVKDSEILEAFRVSQNRVISIAFIHEELYKGGGTDALNFSLYLKKLIENLFQIYRFESTDIKLNMNLEENVFFDMDIAVPLGIIVNELVSNSFKHAFSGRGKGEVQIKLISKETEEYENNGSKKEECKRTNYTLTVSDNGVGIPENLDLENSDTLGMQLVTTLVDQLEGELELKRTNGTEFVIRFTVAGKE